MLAIEPMAEPKKRGRKPQGDEAKPRDTNRHAKPRKAFHADAALFDAMDAYRQSRRPRPDESEIMRTALEEFLERAGFWPYKPSNGGKKS